MGTELYLTPLLLLILAWYHRRSRFRNLVMKYRFALYALRDELRNQVIRGSIRETDWIYDYLDSSISRAIKRLPTFSIYYAVFLSRIYHDDMRIEQFINQLRIEVEKNEEVAKIYSEYGFLLDNFLRERHHESLFVLDLTGKTFRASMDRVRLLKQKGKELSLGFRYYPETSAACSV